MSLSTRRSIFLAASLFILITDGLLFALNAYFSHRALEQHFTSWAIGQRETHDLLLSQTLDTMQLLANLFASDPALHRLFIEGRAAVIDEGGGPGGDQAARMRARLLADLQPWWRLAREQFGMRQLHFHIGPGSLSFLRVHAPEHFGDRLDDLRHIIVDTVADGQPRHGFELGRVYSGLRGVVPLYADLNGGSEPALGAVEVGTSYQAVLDAMQRYLSGSFAVVLDATRVDSALFASERIHYAGDLGVCGCVLEATTDPEISAVVREQGPDWITRIRLSQDEVAPIQHLTLYRPDGRPYPVVVSAWPVHDYVSDATQQGTQVGLVVIWDDATSTMQGYYHGLLISGVYALLTFLALEVFLYYAIRLGIQHLERRIAEATTSIQHLAARLRKRANTDALTGVLNRGAFFELAESRLVIARESATPLSLIMADVDHFKRINDTYGHSAGDQVLRCLSARLSEAIRPEDMVCRFGGEEFVLLLWGAEVENAALTAERIRAAVENMEIRLEDVGHAIRITLSLGVSTRAIA